jgi:hypothetical protein
VQEAIVRARDEADEEICDDEDREICGDEDDVGTQRVSLAEPMAALDPRLSMTKVLPWQGVSSPSPNSMATDTASKDPNRSSQRSYGGPASERSWELSFNIFERHRSSIKSLDMGSEVTTSVEPIASFCFLLI